MNISDNAALLAYLGDMLGGSYVELITAIRIEKFVRLSVITELVVNKMTLFVFLQSLDHPVHVMTGDEDDICHVHVDGVQVCSTRCFEKVVLLFVAVYYVFNMVICQHAMKTVIFILKFGCNLDIEAHDVYVRREYSFQALLTMADCDT